MPDRRARGVLDTSVLVDLDGLDPASLPVASAVSTVTLAELAAGPHAATDPDERSRRQDTLQRAEAALEPLPVDVGVARAYGRVYAATAAAGRMPRGRRTFDLLIAATALAAELPLYTRNPGDFTELAALVEIMAVRPKAEPSVAREAIEPPQPKGG